MFVFENKPKINGLLSIDNIFGNYEGRVLPFVIFFALAAVPLFIWLFILAPIIPVKWLIAPYLYWDLRWALIILGKEKDKIDFYDKQREDEYKAASELIHINYVHDDGLIEYQNGTVAYLITAFPKGYLNDDKFSIDMEAFMNELDNWEWDLFLQNSVDEIVMEENLPKLRRYTDKDIIKDRIEFYLTQDEWSRQHSQLYRFNFLVYTNKGNWKKMRDHLKELVDSDLAVCFNEVRVATREDVDDIMSRDLCAYLNFQDLLVQRYDNTQYFDNQVLWYGDDIPAKYTEDKDKSELDQRRAST